MTIEKYNEPTCCVARSIGFQIKLANQREIQPPYTRTVLRCRTLRTTRRCLINNKKEQNFWLRLNFQVSGEFLRISWFHLPINTEHNGQ